NLTDLKHFLVTSSFSIEEKLKILELKYVCKDVNRRGQGLASYARVGMPSRDIHVLFDFSRIDRIYMFGSACHMVYRYDSTYVHVLTGPSNVLRTGIATE